MEEGPPQNIGENTPYFTISELSKAIKATVEGAFEFVRVRAEISRPTRAASGHLYFTLKDDRSTLAAVCWKTVAGNLAVQPEEGLEVIASGRLTTFAGQSKYQIVGEIEADFNSGKISIQSPLAKALIGKTVGESVEVNTPGGGKSYEILKVDYI